MLSNRWMLFSVFLQRTVLFSRHYAALTFWQCGMKLFFPWLYTVKKKKKKTHSFFTKHRWEVLWICARTSQKEYKNRGCTESLRALKLSFFLIIALSHCAKLCIWVCLLCLNKSGTNTKGSQKMCTLPAGFSKYKKKRKKNDTGSPHGILNQSYRIEGN